ncbi:MAG: nuclear transport factor 2 family protein [Roseococcus sp.]|nr:nuclear transport factor 2 family protein [Roseococcus sp.]
MSEALIRRYYAAFNAADWPAMLDCLTDDVVHDINQGGREAGRDAFAAFLARMERCYAERVEGLVVMVSADGARAAAEFTIHGRYLVADEGLPPALGQGYVLPVGAFFTIREGRIARVTNYYNLQDWLRQVAV